MQTKGANKASKDAIQTICDVIFKVVDHKLKELDSKWTKQIKGKNGQDAVMASVTAVGKSGVLFIVPLNLAISDWRQTSDGTYVAEVQSARVTENMALVGYTLSAEATGNITGALYWEVSAGKVTLITPASPNGVIKGTLVLRK